MALVGGKSYVFQMAIDRRTFTSKFGFPILQRIYCGFPDLNIGSQVGSAYPLRYRSRRGQHDVRKYPFPVLELRQEVIRHFSYTPST